MTGARKYTSSSSFKMALLFGILLGLGVIVLGYFGYYFARGHFIHGTQDTVDTEIRYLARMDDAALRAALQSPAAGRLYLLQGADGAPIAGNIRAWPAAQAKLGDSGLMLVTAGGKRYAAKMQSLQGGRTLYAGVDVTKVIHDYNFMLGLCLLSIILMMIVITVSFFISTFVVSRTNRIAATAKTIMDTGNLSQRVAIDSKWDDLSYLSGVLNAFLARTEMLVEGVQRVSDNIAHDLRTPLTRLRNNLETLRRTDSRAADELIAEADHILATFNALLRIARIETARKKTQFADIDLAPLLRDVADLYEPIAESKNITLALDLADARLTADRDLLFQAFANLLDNAIKFSPADACITLTLATAEGHIHAAVRDEGPGIPDHEKEKVFTRFFRGDQSRHTPGSGLGLSLVAAVADLHDARIVLENAAPGLRVKLIF